MNYTVIWQTEGEYIEENRGGHMIDGWVRGDLEFASFTDRTAALTLFAVLEYDGDTTQHFLIDGVLLSEVSADLRLSIETELIDIRETTRSAAEASSHEDQRRKDETTRAAAGRWSEQRRANR